MKTVENNQDTRELARRVAGVAGDNMPVRIVSGSEPPTVKGEAFCWRTKGGKPIYHPSAYSKKGGSNMVYHRSTRRVEVGEQWLIGRV